MLGTAAVRVNAVQNTTYRYYKTIAAPKGSQAEIRGEHGIPELLLLCVLILMNTRHKQYHTQHMCTKMNFDEVLDLTAAVHNFHEINKPSPNEIHARNYINTINSRAVFSVVGLKGTRFPRQKTRVGSAFLFLTAVLHR